jgi:hypothetical protein
MGKTWSDRIELKLNLTSGGTTMTRLPYKWLTIVGFLLALGGSNQIRAGQQPASGTMPVSMVVTVEAKHGKEVPVVNKEDVRVLQGRERLRATDWIPLQGEHAELELLILIDESSRATLANQYDDLRQFMNGQPPTTAIGIGYIEYGGVRMAQTLTKDREATGKALRIPLGPVAGGNSPYLSIIDAIKRWPDSNARHAIFLVSSGIDPLQPGITDTYLDEAIQIAQRTGTQISTIYAAQAGHFGHSFWSFSRGQDNLSRLAEETGGESYFQGFSTPISFAPFLEEFAGRLAHQYRLTFLIKPANKPSYQHVRLETEVPDADLVAADHVYVPAAK